MLSDVDRRLDGGDERVLHGPQASGIAAQNVRVLGGEVTNVAADAAEQGPDPRFVNHR
ncbi:MAG TPA: hypothetical protein PKA98_07665 [Acidimicrobiales bacterium]|nr:hypothetical protein [Acidimicrobiales bacterium]